MQFEAQFGHLFFFGLLEEEQPVENIGVDDEFVQLLYEKFVLDVEGLDEHDDDVDIVWIVLAILVFSG